MKNRPIVHKEYAHIGHKAYFRVKLLIQQSAVAQNLMAFNIFGTTIERLKKKPFHTECLRLSNNHCRLFTVYLPILYISEVL